MTFQAEQLQNMQDVLDSGTGKYYIRWKDNEGEWHDGPPCYIEKAAAEDQRDRVLKYNAVVEAKVMEVA